MEPGKKSNDSLSTSSASSPEYKMITEIINYTTR